MTVALGVLAAAALAEARPQTTLTQTILDRDRDNRLEPAPGEPMSSATTSAVRIRTSKGTR